MLSDDVKESIGEFDILTDWDQTMINEQSAYMEIYGYLSYLPSYKRISFLKELIKNFDNCRKRDIVFFYSLFKGCPIEIIDKTVYKCTQNMYWNELIGKKNFKRIGTISQNNHRIIKKYLNLKKFREQDAEINVVAANKPEIANGIYTGKVELIVANFNLSDFVREKDYICGKDEKKILDKFGYSGVRVIDMGHGLYIGTKQKYFIKSPLKSRNAYK